MHSAALLVTCLYFFISKVDMIKISTEYRAKSYNFRQQFLVLHYTAIDLKTSIKVLTGDRVSCHYLVPDGPINSERKIYQLVPDQLRAWTNGVSYWRGKKNVNDQAIGVEIVNLGFIDEKNGTRTWFPFSSFQIDSVIQLSKEIIQRYNIDPTNVFGHADCSPGRKQDPGPLFPWKQLYNNGIGAWYDEVEVKSIMSSLSDSVDLRDFQLDLAKYGYKVNTDGVYTQETKDAVVSFQMHFRQSLFDGMIDKETVAILKALIKKYR